MRPRRIERLICIHVLIRDGHYPSSQTIHQYFKVSPRTALRDIRTLKDVFKAPVDYDHTKHGFYYTRKGWNISTLADSQVDLLLVTFRGEDLLDREKGDISDAANCGMFLSLDSMNKNPK